MDDAPFEFGESQTCIVGVLWREGLIEGMLSTKITIDGLDVTKKLSDAIKSSKHPIDAILLQGITFGGFNIMDIHQLHKKTGLPIIVISRRKPDMEKVRKALSHLPQSGHRLSLIEKAGEMKTYKNLFYQSVGTSEPEAIIDRTLVQGNIPEPIRLAHVIVSGISFGEVKCRA